MIALVLGLAAMARPLPLLGPDGPLWIGPLPPQTVAARPWGAGGWARPVVAVDPVDGHLWVQEWDAADLERTWQGGAWTYNGLPLTERWPPPERLRLDREGERLYSVATAALGRRRFLYDDAGRLTAVIWGDGSRLDVAYDDAGRVTALSGPGMERLDLIWGSGLVVRDILGRQLTVSPVASGERGDFALEVRDGAGRVARTWYRTAAGGERTIAGWSDPRGLHTRITRDDGEVGVEAPGGARWRLRVDGQDRVQALTMPSGARWRWARDDAGRVVQVTDPMGGSERWERDTEGEITQVVRGGQFTHLRRDPSGRVVEITDPNGASTRLERSSRGEVSAIIDATGNEIHIARGPEGLPAAVIGRSGARWKVTRDTRGRVRTVVDPTTRETTLSWGPLGNLRQLSDSVFGALKFQRRADGRLTRVVGDDGRTLGVLRDGLGRSSAVLRPGGRIIRIERDTLGDIAALVWGDEVLEIRRDAMGRPIAAGAVRWRRDLDGRVAEITAPGLELSLGRDGAGRLREVKAGDWRLSLRRDAVGRVVTWEGSDAAVTVERDPAGRVIGESGGVRLARDPRGYVVRATLGERVWRWTRDAAGWLLTGHGPGDLSVGIDRDSAGRVKLVRLSGGEILRRRYEGALVVEEVLDSDSRLLQVRTTRLEADGRVRWRQESGGSRQLRVVDDDGRLQGIEPEDPEEEGWTWEDGVARGPFGTELGFDADGRIVTARPPPGPQAWGVGAEGLDFQRDDAGRLTEVVGGRGTCALTWDPLLRLTAIDAPTGMWRVSWDARGRPAALSGPAGTTPLQWGPTGLLGSGDASWIAGPDGLAGSADDGVTTAFMALADGLLGWIMPAVGPAMAVHPTLGGASDTEASGLVGVGQLVRLFPGGPLIGAAGDREPLSGQPLASAVPWPWELAPPALHTRLDDTPWRSEQAWGTLPGLLVELEIIAPIDDALWSPMPAEEAAPVGWLPRAMQEAPPPLGPARGALPLAEDPITMALIRAALPGGASPEPELIVRTMLEEAALPPPADHPMLALLRP